MGLALSSGCVFLDQIHAVRLGQRSPLKFTENRAQLRDGSFVIHEMPTYCVLLVGGQWPGVRREVEQGEAAGHRVVQSRVEREDLEPDVGAPAYLDEMVELVHRQRWIACATRECCF